MNNEFPHTHHEISTEDLELLEDLFRENLPESPIDLNLYEKLSLEDEDIKTTFESMLKSCLRYTDDVALLEKYTREHQGEFDEERELIDKKRTYTHNATISDINIFYRTLKKKGVTVDWLKWQDNNRAAYGSFAILITLNRFKDDIIAFRDKIVLETARIISQSNSIDFESLKKDLVGTELRVIEYVQALSSILINDLPTNDAKWAEIDVLRNKIGKTETEILSAFHKIYLKRYK